MRFSAKTLALGATVALCAAPAAHAQTSILADPVSTGGDGQHHSVVEPDNFASGSTIVAAAQVGRIFNGGSDRIGFATSTNNGSTWTAGMLPGLTKPQGGTVYDRATDASVAYDAKHNVWLISTLGLTNTSKGPNGAAVLTSRSSDGVTWGNPVVTAAAGRREDFDKNWIACDNTPTSTYYGSCYTEYDNYGSNNALKMAYSRDGGATWTASSVPRAGVIGGQPLVLPNGNVVVPLDNASETALGYTVSTNGGVKFGSALTITSISAATDPGGIRSGPLPSAEIAGGKIYVAWSDCRFRANCAANDIVYTTSTNGTSWTAVQRVPIDGVTSGIDHTLPGVAASGSTVDVTYYTDVAGTLQVGHIASTNGGSTWGTPATLSGTMAVTDAPNTSQGYMVGDYISSAFGSDGLVHPVWAFAVAPPSGGLFNQPLFSAAVTATGGTASPAAAVAFSGQATHGNSAFPQHQEIAD